MIKKYISIICLFAIFSSCDKLDELTKFDIIIDDRADTVGRWKAKGGTGIVFKSPDQVINDLKKIGL